MLFIQLLMVILVSMVIYNEHLQCTGSHKHDNLQQVWNCQNSKTGSRAASRVLYLYWLLFTSNN